MTRISPSVASADPLNLRRAVEYAERCGYEDLHIDIEDGNFIPNITFGMRTVRALRGATHLPFSFHLMVLHPESYLEEVMALGPSIVFAHVEALAYPSNFTGHMREAGVRSGLALNPKTPVEPLAYILQDLDGILVMTSEPDGRGQLFLPQVLEKIRTVRRLAPSVEIWADGGIRRSQLVELECLGVRVAVMGRAVFEGSELEEGAP
ncbi:ribulose-phosphate 3-epimerase [uncultured Fretibacterium sp.]|uniref:ribulose-phosphate 3-epimerase n=1 Tax=uncultured Fretibacterium sp. TaxID=1678694 RepID=UPI0026349EA8|nr:ribulose-phosphate 3-epimerase [uncultured Fretibacterium sp.]